MTTITTRTNKDSELTYAEGDANIDLDIHTEAMPYTADADDNRAVVECTGTGDFTLPVATTIIDPQIATPWNDYQVTIKNTGAGVVTVKTQSTDTLDGVAATGDQAINPNEAFTYKVNVAEDGYVAIAKVSANALNSDAVITDDALIKGDGGARLTQTTGIIVADTSNNVTGMGTLSCGAITSASISGTSATVTGATQAAITTCANLTTVGTLVAGDATGIVDAATLTAAGKVELATVSETNTGTDATRAVTPDGLDGWTGSAQVTTVGTVGSGTWQGTDVAVAHGGTGVSTLDQGGVMLGSGSSNVTVLAPPSDAAKILTAASGATADPTWEFPKYCFIGSSTSSLLTTWDRYFSANGEAVAASSEATVRSLVPIAGNIKNLYFQTGSNGNGAGNLVVTLVLDGTPTALTVSVTPGTTTVVSDTSNSFAVTAGQGISMRINNAAGNGTIGQMRWGFMLE